MYRAIAQTCVSFAYITLYDISTVIIGYNWKKITIYI